jgi:hypothetical protein
MLDDDGKHRYIQQANPSMTHEISDSSDTDEEQAICLEPLPACADERCYLDSVAHLSVPTRQQIADFVSFVSGGKSWYKHLPARPPGAPMYFYLDPNAGRDRLRRWGHQVIYRDRSEDTRQIHYSWMSTQEYRRQFGYLAYCCPASTGIWTDEMLAGGNATLDPNVSEPLIEGEPGRLALVPQVVLEVGVCFITRTVHARTDATSLWKKWNKTVDRDHDADLLSGHWPRIARLCEELGVKHFRGLEKALNGLIARQRREDHCAMEFAIWKMIDFFQRTHNGCWAHD